jgi:hypothetical protein
VKKLSALIAACFISTSAAYCLELPLIFGFGALGEFNITSVKGNRAYQTGLEGEFDYSIFSGGFYAFYDFFYGELAFGFAGLLNSVKGNPTLAEAAQVDNHDGTILLDGNYIVISLIGKYPFEFNNFLLYPLLGFEARLCLAMKYTEDAEWAGANKGASYNHENPSNWNTILVKIGLGGDFLLSESLFIRSTLSFNIKFNTPRETEISRRIAENSEYKDSTIFGAGGQLTISIGYNFGSTNVFESGGGGGGSKRKSGGSGGARKTTPSKPSDIYMPR